MELNYEKDLEIDKFQLDKECLTHAKMYYNYAEAAQDAKARISKAKDNVEFVTAKRNIEIRKEYETIGKKFTEAVITSELALDKDVIFAKNELRDAEELYGKLQVAVNAMEIKGNELDNLVKLFGSQYFSTTKDYGNEIRKNLNKNVK